MNANLTFRDRLELLLAVSAIVFLVWAALNWGTYVEGVNGLAALAWGGIAGAIVSASSAISDWITDWLSDSITSTINDA